MRYYLVGNPIFHPNGNLLSNDAINKFFECNKLMQDPNKEILLYKNYRDARTYAVNVPPAQLVMPIFVVNLVNPEVVLNEGCAVAKCTDFKITAVSLVHRQGQLYHLLTEDELKAGKKLVEAGTVSRLSALTITDINKYINIIQKTVKGAQGLIATSIGAGFWHFGSRAIAKLIPTPAFLEDKRTKELLLSGIVMAGAYVTQRLQPIKNLQQSIIRKSISTYLRLKYQVKPRDIFESPEDELKYNQSMLASRRALANDDMFLNLGLYVGFEDESTIMTMLTSQAAEIPALLPQEQPFSTPLAISPQSDLSTSQPQEKLPIASASRYNLRPRKRC